MPRRAMSATVSAAIWSTEHLRPPERALAAQAGDQHQHGALALLLVVDVGVADRDVRHGRAGYFVSFIPMRRSIAITSAGRSNGAGAGAPGCRGRPMLSKKSSRPGGVITQSITRSSSELSLISSCLTS